jgi:hypothetical protein
MESKEKNRKFSRLEIENDLNNKIIKITQKINIDHPELIKYLDEMPITIPDEKDPDLNFITLQNYYDSLITFLSKYEIEHPT